MLFSSRLAGKPKTIIGYQWGGIRKYLFKNNVEI